MPRYSHSPASRPAAGSRGCLNFGTLIWRHDLAFDEKWVKALDTKHESLLGSPDVASLADLGLVYEHVERMQIIPFDKKAAVVLVLADLDPDDPPGGHGDSTGGDPFEAG